MSYERILVPLDGSQLAEYIIPHVENLARAFESEVTLFHVVEAEEPEPAQLTPSQREARADITQYLERVSASMEQRKTLVKWLVSYGSPSAEIVRQASAGEYDLVMMSTHGQGQERVRSGAGSVAMEVVSAGRVPVMVVRPPDQVVDR